jgi:hypothetical protein
MPVDAAYAIMNLVVLRSSAKPPNVDPTCIDVSVTLAVPPDAAPNPLAREAMNAASEFGRALILPRLTEETTW